MLNNFCLQSKWNRPLDICAFSPQERISVSAIQPLVRSHESRLWIDASYRNLALGLGFQLWVISDLRWHRNLPKLTLHQAEEFDLFADKYFGLQVCCSDLHNRWNSSPNQWGNSAFWKVWTLPRTYLRWIRPLQKMTLSAKGKDLVLQITGQFGFLLSQIFLSWR